METVEVRFNWLSSTGAYSVYLLHEDGVVSIDICEDENKPDRAAVTFENKNRIIIYNINAVFTRLRGTLND